jgi:hypothetical protein
MSTPLRFIPDEAKRFKDRNGQRIAVVEITNQVAPNQVAPDC